MVGTELSPAVGFMHVGLGRMLYQWNRLAEAELHFRQALQFAQRCGDYKMLIYSREGLADLLAATGDHAGASAMLQALEQHVQADGMTLRRAMLALNQGDLLPMQQWATRLDLCIDDPPEKLLTMPAAYASLVRLKLCQRTFDGVDALLNCLADIGESRRSLPFLLRVRRYQTLSIAKQGDLQTAVSIFHQLPKWSSHSTPSKPTPATSTTSSTCATAPKPSPAPASSTCCKRGCGVAEMRCCTLRNPATPQLRTFRK
mgnify:CR=1 FL=1